MTVILKKTDSPEEVKRKIDQFMEARRSKNSPKEGFDPSRFLGKLKGMYGDPMEYQRSVRDEWA